MKTKAKPRWWPRCGCIPKGGERKLRVEDKSHSFPIATPGPAEPMIAALTLALAATSGLVEDRTAPVDVDKLDERSHAGALCDTVQQYSGLRRQYQSKRPGILRLAV